MRIPARMLAAVLACTLIALACADDGERRTEPGVGAPALEPAGAIGSSCSATNPCDAGFCVRGVCCSTPCTQTCYSCAASEKESGTNDGICGPAKANTKPAGPCYQHGEDVDTECKYKAGEQAFCNGYGVCSKPVDTQCKTECDGDGVQTYKCKADGKCHAEFGDCGTYTCGNDHCFTNCDFDDDSKCAPGNWCRSGQCIPPQSNGKGCSKKENCISGFCVEGVCCSDICNTPCKTCLAANMDNGNTGVCDDVKPGGSKENQKCPVGGTCGTDGTCDGSGECAFTADSAPCNGIPTCEPASTFDGTSKITGLLCDGAGQCKDQITTKECTGYSLCLPNGECPTSCVSSAECAAGYSCYDADGDPSTKECAQKLVAGNCTAHDQCLLGFCYDNHCCNVPCDGDCQNCLTGKCETTPAGPPKGVKASGEAKACDVATAGNPCVAFQCNGTTTGCDGLVGAEVACQAASCADGEKSLAAGCNGAGACSDPVPVPCDGFACNGLECKTSCASNEDCSIGAVCDPKTGNCSKGSSCLDATTVKDLNGTLTNCSPFRCVGGTCVGACSSNEQCAAGYLCDHAKANCIVPLAGDDVEPPSCVCGMTRAREPSGLWLFGAALGMTLARMRSRRR